MARKFLFEVQGCSRCGGSGQYSYCQSYGTTCFKCAGETVVLTKRGRAAALFLRKLRTKPMAEVQFGEAVLLEGVPGMTRTTWFKVEEMHSQIKGWGKPGPNGETEWFPMMFLGGTTKQGEKTGYGGQPETEVRIVPATREIKEAQIAQALAFQATLTKMGTPMKRAAGAAQKEAA